MNWDDLRIFLEVSRHPRLDQAASQLHQDATTVSRRLRRLEEDLGLVLFERTRRGHILTPAGEALARRAEDMEAKAWDIASFAETGAGRMAGRVRIGITEGLGAKFVSPALADLSKQHPQIDIELIALSGFVSVPRREADMSVLLTRPKAGRLMIRKLTDYTLHLYAATSYEAQNAPIRTIDDLRKHRLIGYVDDLIYSDELRYHAEVLPGQSVRLSSSSILAQAEMVRSNAGIAVLPDFIAARDKDLTPILENDICVRRSFWLAVHEDLHQLPRIRAVIQFLTSLAQQNQRQLRPFDH